MDMSLEQIVQKYKSILLLLLKTFVVLSIASFGIRSWIQQESSSHEQVYAEHLRNVEQVVRAIKDKRQGFGFDENKPFSEQLSLAPDSQELFQKTIGFWTSDSAKYLKSRYPRCFVGDFSMSTTPRHVKVAGRYWSGCENFEVRKGPIEIAADFVFLYVVLPVLGVSLLALIIYLSENTFLSYGQRSALDRIIREQQNFDSSHVDSLSAQEIEKLRRILNEHDKRTSNH